ncbi:MAG: methyltransferase [Gemmatimonadetes bacterium]|nr:methyltransferase [Gemmatimonadota bacterium]
MASLQLPAHAGRKRYDEDYFEKWYRNPRTRVHTPESVRRKVRMVLGVAEYFLQREVRSVLDIGCGEGAWRGALRKLRPHVRYQGIDPSEYVVRRFGRRRNICLGSFEDVPGMRLGGKYDLIICADVLQYVPTLAVKRGVDHIASVLNGVTFLESYTSDDEDHMTGDLAGWHSRSKAQYRRLFSDAGLVACGLHCYVADTLAVKAVELELV